MDAFFQVLVIGLASGLTLSLMALGLTLIYGVMQTVNFAHGQIYVLGGYSYVAVTSAGLPVPVAVVTAPAAGWAIGWVLHRLLLRRRTTAFARFDYASYVVVVTFAVGIIVQNAAALISDGSPSRPPGLWESTVTLGGARIAGDRLVGALAAIVAVAALVWFMRSSYTGRAWRALVDNRTGAEVVGIDADRASRSAFAAASALAALAGGLLAPLFTVFPEAGITPVVQGFIVILIGGLGSIAGSLVGGLAVGLANTFGATYISADFSGGYAFALMILILLIFPRGLFGREAVRF
jgi:branched-chain amino acid transport system permease protein